MEFDICQQVRVKENFDEIRFDRDPGITTEMLEMKGKEYTIREADGNYECGIPCYTLVEDKYKWRWSEKWLEPAYDSNIEVSDEDLFELMK